MDKIKDFIEKEYILEDYCPHCNEESRMVKVFDCSDRYYRCLACLKLIWRGAIPLSVDEVPRWWNENPKPESLRKFADLVEQRDKEDEENKNQRRIRIA